MMLGWLHKQGLWVQETEIVIIILVVLRWKMPHYNTKTKVRLAVRPAQLKGGKTMTLSVIHFEGNLIILSLANQNMVAVRNILYDACERMGRRSRNRCATLRTHCRLEQLLCRGALGCNADCSPHFSTVTAKHKAPPEQLRPLPLSRAARTFLLAATATGK
jgi:hypothetical protein